MIWQEDISIPIEHQNLVNDRITKAKTNTDQLLNWDIACKNSL